MKIKLIEGKDQLDNKALDVAFDVSGASLDYSSYCLTERGKELWEGHLRNRAGPIKKELPELDALARKHGYPGIRVLCEATGVYHRMLLKVANELGIKTAIISGEAVSKTQVVQSNDYNKNDVKDPKTMLVVSEVGKPLQDRRLSGGWLVMRQLNLEYDRNQCDGTRFKNRIHQGLFELFPDLGFKNEWINESRASCVVAELYGFNPYRIIDEGRARFTQKLKRLKLRRNTINRLWEYAKESTVMLQDKCITACMEDGMRELHAQLQDLLAKRLELRSRLVVELEKLYSKGLININPHASPIGPFMLARIFAETGPFSDFMNPRKLLRYAGLNIIRKESGTFKGQEKIAKKGRARLRRCLQQASLKLVVKGELYGDYFHGKKASGMKGNKAMVAVSRKLLKMLFGLEKSGGAYNVERVFQNHLPMKKAA